jgi:tRNA(Arg) A34 adenosine deaminase TadA
MAPTNRPPSGNGGAVSPSPKGLPKRSRLRDGRSCQQEGHAAPATHGRSGGCLDNRPWACYPLGMDAGPKLIADVRVSLPGWAADFAATVAPRSGDADRMRAAVELSRLNVVEGTGGPFGAAVFERESGRLVGVGVNRVVPLGNSALHAEVVALMLAEAALGSFTLHGPGRPAHELFTSCEPCAMCLGAIWWSGVRRVVCGASRADATDLGFDEGPVFEQSYAYLESRGLAVVHGVLREEAHSVLRLYADRQGLVYNA